MVGSIEFAKSSCGRRDALSSRSRRKFDKAWAVPLFVRSMTEMPRFSFSDMEFRLVFELNNPRFVVLNRD